MRYVKFYSILLILLSLFISMGFIKTNAAAREAYNIITNPGEDMSTTVRINWHSDINDSFLEYTTIDDEEYENKIIVEPSVRTFSKPANENGYTSQGFAQRYVCTAVINDLKPGTKYMYRVGKTTFSQNYYFETASNDEFTFVHITDPQYANVAGAEVFNTLLGKAYEMEDIAFSFFTGDVVDRGGIESQWSLFFSRSNIPNGIIATGVGNHEYYDASSTPKHYNNGWYNGFNNNPQNGPEEVLNSCYYFYYNNVLFFMLDTETDEVEAQKEWFAEVCEQNFDKEFIIVGMHRSMYGSIYSEQGEIVRREWQGLFDKYGVDLVLSGHDHIYARSHRIYKNKISEEAIYGTTYIIGGSGGKKFYQADSNSKYAKVVEYTSVANLITISNNRITTKLIDTSGNVKDTYVINLKRKGSFDNNFDKEVFKKSFIIEQDETQMSGTLKWDNNFYGNVVNIGIRRQNESTYLSELYLYNGNQTELKFSGIRPKDLNLFEIDIEYLDGTIETLEIEIDNTEPYYPSIYEVLEMIKVKINDVVNSAIFKDE